MQMATHLIKPNTVALTSMESRLQIIGGGENGWDIIGQTKIEQLCLG